MKENQKKCESWWNWRISRSNRPTVFCKQGVLKNCTKLYLYLCKMYLCWSLFLMKFQALRPANLLKSDSSKDVFPWILRSLEHLFCRISANGCFWISQVLDAYLPFWSPFRRGSVKNYFRITPEFFNEIYVLVEDNITK